MNDDDKKIEEISEKKIEERQEEENSKEKKEPSKKKGFSLVVMGCVLLILILVIGAYFYKDKLLKPVEEKTSSSDKKEYHSVYRMSGNSLQDFDLYFLQLENGNKNKVYSPLSIKYALEMLAEGASGDTKSQLDAVIGDYVAKSYTNSEHMSFANAMFVRSTFKDSIKEEYTKLLASKYNASVMYDGFENANAINNWASEKTFKLINNLVSDDSLSEANFALINALAIDMNWTSRLQYAMSKLPDGVEQYNYYIRYPHENYGEFIRIISEEVYDGMSFNNQENVKSVTIGASFNRYDIFKELGEENIRNTVTAEYQEYVKVHGTGECGTVDEYMKSYMQDLGGNYKSANISTEFSIYVDDNVKVFAKDLKEYDGVTLQYVGVMPKNMSLDTYISSLKADDLNALIRDLKEVKYENFKEGVITKVKGSIPLFKFDYQLDLVKDLKQLGIDNAFDYSKANFSNIAKGKQFINDASHKAAIEFSNDGIKAAAVTSTVALGASGCGFDHVYDVPVETIDITFDQPFMFLIRDKVSGEVWFTGTVYEPTLNS